MATKFLHNPMKYYCTLAYSNRNNPNPNKLSSAAKLHSLFLPWKYYCNKSSPTPKIDDVFLFCCNNPIPRQAPHQLRASSVGDHHHHNSPSSSSSTNDDDDDEEEEGKSSSALEKQKEEEGAAREAVSGILQEFGASKEDSVVIALRSPKYLAMLVESVRDLDELSLWDSWSRRRRSSMNQQSASQQQQQEESGGEDPSSTTPTPTPLSLKEKVYYMAMEKGDKGLLPFLESLGMTLPSATHFARYLSSQTLPNLIQKVKYVKEMLFSDSDDEGLIGKRARRMMMHLSIPVDEDVQQTLSFFEKIEARRGGLDMLGSKDATFRYLVESFPRLLLLSLESHMKPMVKFLEEIGVPRGCTTNILISFPPIIFYDIEKDIKLRIHAFEKVGAGGKDFGKMLLKYPWILSTGIQENYEEILSFFDMEKVPKVSVHRAIKSWPLLLGCSISKLKVMVDQFGELGVRNKKLGHVIATSPQLLLRKPQEILQVVSFFKDLGLDEETIGRVLVRCPEIFAASIEKTLKKKLDFLTTTIGVCGRHLPVVVRRYPELLVSDVDRAMLPRIKYLMKMGLSKNEVKVMVRGFSPLLGYSIEEVLRPKVEFLVKTMGKRLKEVVEYPRYFSYSLERKIKPRYWVLKARNCGESCSLKDMLSKNDEEFAAEFMGLGSLLDSPSSSSSSSSSSPLILSSDSSDSDSDSDSGE